MRPDRMTSQLADGQIASALLGHFTLKYRNVTNQNGLASIVSSGTCKPQMKSRIAWQIVR